MKRSEAERVRIKEQISRLRTTIDSIEEEVTNANWPCGAQIAQILTTSSQQLASSLVKFESYHRCETEGCEI